MHLRVPHHGALMVEPETAGGHEAQGARVCAVLRLVDARGEGLHGVFLEDWDALLDYDWAGIHTLLWWEIMIRIWLME